MKVKIPTTVWITDPSKVVTLNPDDPREFFGQVSIQRETFAELSFMADSWLYIGEAVVNVTLTESPETIRRGALQRLQAKLSQLDAEHQKTRMAFESAMNKLQSLGWDGK